MHIPPMDVGALRPSVRVFVGHATYTVFDGFPYPSYTVYQQLELNF